MDIERKVKQTLAKIKLSKKEKILVALSGGKDSSVCAYLLKKLGYKIEGIHINLHMGLCKNLGIKLHLYDIKKELGASMCYLRTSILSSHNTGKRLKNCAICGVIKKWILNKKARELKASKLATGHSLDDEAQTFLINIFKGSPELSANAGPISRNVKDNDKKFVPRIKPLFFVPENEIRKFSKSKKLPVVYEKCPCALDSYRIQVREFVNTLSDREKENIMKNFERFMEKMKKETDANVKYCKICGEPARNEICKRCELMRIK